MNADAGRGATPTAAAARAPIEPHAAGAAAARDQRGHLPAFDGIRFACAALVMLYHYTGPWRGEAWGAPFRYGFLGVDAFFIISGLFISMTAEGRGALSFAWARLVRLAPAFWVCCTITASAAWIAAEPVPLRDFALNLTMAPTLFGGRYVDGVYWTIACEIAFYSLVFAALTARAWRFVERIGYAWLATIAACTLWWPAAPIWTAVTMKGYAQYFVAGLILWLARRERLTIARAAGLVVALALSIAHVHLRPETRAVPWLPCALVICGIYAVTSVCALGATSGASRRVASLGAASYPLYLIHQRIGLTVLGRLAPAPGWRAAAVIACLSVTMVGAALLVHLVVERPAQRALKRVVMRGSRRAH